MKYAAEKINSHVLWSRKKMGHDNADKSSDTDFSPLHLDGH